MLSQRRQQTPYGILKKVLILTIGGGIVFWGATIATSLLPIAAKYRASFSNWSIQTVWIAFLPAGMIIGGCVSYSLFRLFEKLPTRDPILGSVILSSVALVVATILIDVPRSFPLSGSTDALYYFLIGVMFNATRFLLLGLVIGYLYNKLYGSTRS
jgi:hypothetical protein